MINASIKHAPPVFLMRDDKIKCLLIAGFVVLQCLLVFGLSYTVLYCVWNPNLMPYETYKLISITYLFDKQSCGNEVEKARVISSLKLSNDSKGYNVLPFRCEQATLQGTPKLSAQTRTYIEISIIIHAIWMTLTFVIVCIVIRNKTPKLLRFTLTVFFGTFIFIFVFEISMAIVYAATIKQSLTTGMILRYSGWGLELKLDDYERFAGYVPILAAMCWLKGIVILAVNVYCFKHIHFIQSNIKSRVLMTRVVLAGYKYLPSAREEGELDPRTLYYRAGEEQPYVKKIVLRKSTKPTK